MQPVSNDIHSVISVIKTVIIVELKKLIYPNGKNESFKKSHGSPYIMFSPILVCIEFLGACYDEFPFEQTRLDKKDIVEERFKKAIKKLFPEKYDKYNKSDSNYYLYKKFRCPMIHGLRLGSKIAVSTRFNSIKDKTKHLDIDSEEYLILVLEDLYDDLEKAALRIIRKFETKQLTNKKGDKHYWKVRSYN